MINNSGPQISMLDIMEEFARWGFDAFVHSSQRPNVRFEDWNLGGRVSFVFQAGLNSPSTDSYDTVHNHS